jgi:glutamine amidotransferase
MHNGEVAEFAKIKRRLQAGISDEIFDSVKGNTGKW